MLQTNPLKEKYENELLHTTVQESYLRQLLILIDKHPDLMECRYNQGIYVSTADVNADVEYIEFEVPENKSEPIRATFFTVREAVRIYSIPSSVKIARFIENEMIEEYSGWEQVYKKNGISEKFIGETKAFLNQSHRKIRSQAEPFELTADIAS